MSAAPRRRRLLGVLVLAGLALAFAVVRLFVYRDTDGVLWWAWGTEDIARLRATSVVVATIVGVALAISGLLLQALLRNPLASPFILGVSSGAALGVMAAIFLTNEIGGPWRAGGDAPAALLGAGASLLIVYGLGQRRGWVDPLSLVLTGVVVSAICGALIMFLQYLVPHGLRGDLISWMMGTVPQGVGARTLVVAGVLVAAGAALAFTLGGAMDAATLGDEEARSVGLRVGPVRLALFAVAGALAAIAVALAGPIGFVGLVAPHAARLVLGPRHAVLVIGAACAGAALLIGADVASQVVPVRGGRMPVGVFTALLGGPAFIWLLRTGRGQA